MDDNFIDSLKRALEMEEIMDKMLVSLIKFSLPVEGLDAAQNDEFNRILQQISNDTARHKKIVEDLLLKTEQKIG